MDLFKTEDLSDLRQDAANASVTSQTNQGLLNHSGFGLSSIKHRLDQVWSTVSNLWTKVDTEIEAIKAQTDKLGDATYGLVGWRSHFDNWMNNNLWNHGNYGLVGARNEVVYGRVAIRQLLDAMNGTLSTINTNTSAGGGIKKVQRGASSGGYTVYVNISAIDPSKAFVVAYGWGNNVSVGAYIVSPTELRFYVPSPGLSVHWQVVEFH